MSATLLWGAQAGKGYSNAGGYLIVIGPLSRQSIGRPKTRSMPQIHIPFYKKALQTELSPIVADLPKHWHDELAFTLVEGTMSKHIYHFLYHRVLRISGEVSSVSICYLVDGEPRSTCQALSGGTFEGAQLPSLQRDADSQSNAVN